MLGNDEIDILALRVDDTIMSASVRKFVSYAYLFIYRLIRKCCFNGANIQHYLK